MAEARWEHIQSTRASADINWTLASGFWMKRYGFFCWYWRKSFSCSRFSTWLEAGMYYLRDLALKRKRICFSATSWIETSNATEIFLKTNSVHTYYKNLNTNCFSASTGHLKKPPLGWLTATRKNTRPSWPIVSSSRFAIFYFSIPRPETPNPTNALCVIFGYESGVF